MRGVLLLFLLSLFCSSCFTSNNKKSPYQKKRDDSRCNGKLMRKEYNAIHPRELKVVYYVVNQVGDTVQTDYTIKDLGDMVGFKFFGFDTIIPKSTYKGKPFTGTTVHLTLERSEREPLQGCYKHVKTYKDGILLFSETYYPNGQLKEIVKGKNKGILSEMTIKYDMNGRVVKHKCHQPGLYFTTERSQEKTEFNTMGALGFEMRLIDTTLGFKENFIVERRVRNENIKFDVIDYGNRNFQPIHFINYTKYEKLVYQKYYDNTGRLYSSDFSINFYDYLKGGERSWSNVRNDEFPDSIFRLHIEFLDYGGIKTLGQYFLDLRHGIWNYYNDDGTLKDVELYESGRKHFSLHDENAFIFFHVLYNRATGEVLQYKNDWVPHINQDSMFLYDFNQHSFYRHEKNNYNSLRRWSLTHGIFNNSEKLDKLFHSMYKIELYPDGRTKSIGFVTDKEERTGIWIDFSHDGDTVVICDYYYGKPNGIYRKYINEVLVEKRDEIPEWRKNDPRFFLSIPYSHTKSQFFKRRNYWFRHWQKQ